MGGFVSSLVALLFLGCLGRELHGWSGSAKTTLLGRVRIKPLTLYYRNRILRWAGHGARMPMTRILRKLLTGWVANPRLLGRPYYTWGHTLLKGPQSA